MKFLLIVLVFLASFVLEAKSVSKRKVDDLEQRIEVLEKKVEALVGSKSVTGIRIKDSKNEIIQAGVLGRGTASGSELSADQQAEIYKKIENFKENQSKSQKLLDELMNEDF